ncbi:processed acidic surface protein [Peribacillus frigoritolerans]|uniref:processed acidic surface protein n=1 Tax=Peribacillus frigoritolerans TaxID=450367 RepID=UPI00207923E1|nr:processed acidic surface protein [Peribacillus frigoritolerans]MDM5308930.1 processed acidic surface protein [Peribacillus frigoritolerans]USK80200.1 processed acidic surface protein [Peribacillus frigoritolerans]WJE47464.1 processed acidic surface protein [Peribacillus frigoritolerans]
MKKHFSFFVALIVLFSLGSSGTKGFAATKINQDELNAYLSEVRMTQEELEEYLSYYDLTLNELKSAEELRETLGPAVTPETLQNLLKQYEMTEAELTELLMEYGELEEGDSIIDTFHFIYDIEDIIDLEMGYDEEEMEYDEEEISDLMDGLFTEIGLTDEELDRFMNHLLPIVEDPSFESRLMAISDRMNQLEYFETIDELSAEQVAELLSIYNDLQSLLQIQFKFALIQEGVTTNLSLEALFQLKELTNASLLVSIYDLNGNFLLDFTLTGEMIGSDLVKETGNDMKQSTEVISKVAEVKKEKKKPAKPEHKTEKGGVLPKTAGNYLFGALCGLVLMGIAFGLIRKARLTN